MVKGHRRGLPDKYGAPFLTAILAFLCLFGYSQTYQPGIHVPVNDAIGQGAPAPLDGRTMYWDGVNFLYRPFASTSEVISYFPNPNNRVGNYIIVVDSGGTLQSNGKFLNGHNVYYMWADTTSNAGLVKLNLFGANGCSGCLLAANNLNDLTNKPQAIINLGLGTMATQNVAAGGDLSGNWNNITVAKFNGQLPSYYLAYGNLTGTPAPLALTTTGTSGLATYNPGTGVLNIPNYSGSGGSCLNCNADTIGHIPLNFTSFPNGSVLTLDSAAGYAYWAPQSGGVGTLPPNIGTGFTIYAPQVPGIRTLICNSGCTIDSTSNSGSLTFNITTSGVGTVTSFSAGNLSALFTTSVATASTTPALTFNPATFPAYNIYGNNTASPAAAIQFAPTSTILNQWFGGTIQPAITFTTTGTGAPTFVSNTLNIPTAVMTYSQLATTNTLNINPGNTQTFLVATHAFAGLMDSASKAVVDSLRLRTYTWPITNIFAVEGTSPAGSDSIQFGGSLGAFYKPDTLYTQYQGLYIYNLNDKSTLGAGDSVLILDAAKQMRLVPSSAIGGSGAVSSVADNGTGTTVISPTTGSVLVGVNASAFPVSFVPAVNNSVNIGSSSKNWENLYVNNIISPGALAFEVPTGSAYQFNINGTTNMGLLTTGQLQLQNYTTTSSFTGTAVGVLEFTSSGAIITAGLPSGAVSSVSDNGGGTLTISPTTGAVLAGINLANSNTWTATNNSFKNILPSATTTYSLGSTGAYWNNVYTNNLDVNNILPPSNLVIQLATGQLMETYINGTVKEELLSTGQKQLNGYGSGTFTGTPTFALNVDATGHLIEGAVGGGGGITQLFGKSPIAVSGTDTAYMDTTMLINAQYPYGYEYNKNYFADTLDFRTTLNSTMSVDTSMHLEIGNNGSTDSTGNVIKMVNATLLEKFVMTAQVIVTTPGKGFGIGLYGQNAAEPISLLGFVPTAGAPVGKASLTTESNSTWASQNVSSTPISISSGDTLTCTLTRADSVITYTVTQTATKGGATSSATFTYNLTGSPLLPNTAYWSIWPMGGAYTVLSLSVFTATPHHATLMAVGDSKTQGYFQTYFADRWVNRINAASPNYQTVVANGGGGDFTDNVIARLHEIKWLHPARVLLFIGSNDERNGRTLLQWETNYDYIADQLTKAGITVYHLLQTNETTLNFTAYNNHILQTFPASRIVNAGVISLYSDGIHPDSAGARQIADSVISQIGSQLAPIAPIIPAIRMQDLITSADTGANKTWPVNRILKATSLGYPRQVPFGTNQQNFPLTGPQVSGGGLSQSGNFTFDSLTNILHIGNPAVGPNLTDLAGNGAFITAGFNPNASLQYIPTSTSASAIYMSGGSIYWYQNTGLTVGTAFSIRNTFQATPGTSGSTFTFNPSNVTPNFNTLISNGDTRINGTVFVEPIAATANGTITLNSNPITTSWNLTVFESTSQFAVEDLSHGTSPFAIASSAPTSSQNIFASGNTGFNTSTDVASSLVTMVSTAKGFLPPRMTTAQFTAISSPATSLHAVLTDSGGRMALWNGSKIITYATTDMLGSGSVNIYNTNGTLTGNRTLTLGGNTLAFSGLVGPPSTFAAIVHSTASDSGTYQVPLAYGTYIPTLTNTTNITSSTVNQAATYTRIGNIVHVNIACIITPTTASTATVLTFTLPFTTSNGSPVNIGSAALDINSGGVGTYTSGIVSLASTTTATLSFNCTSLAGSSNVNIQFDYSL